MRRAPVVVVLLLLLAACTADPADTTGVAPAPGSAAASAAPATAGPADGDVLAFTTDLVGGGTFDGGEYAGQDLMLWFWAPW